MAAAGPRLYALAVLVNSTCVAVQGSCGEDPLGVELLQRQVVMKSANLVMDSVVRPAGKDSYGTSGCQCITSLIGALGQVNVTLSSRTLLYPADVGSRCETWDEGLHPDCKEGSLPDWCTQAWCYVDPTSCDGGSVPPETSAYQPEASFLGMPLYYSYATCRGSDSFTATEHKGACVNQKSESDCTAQPKCAWAGSPGKCLGKNLVQRTEIDASVMGHETCRCIGVANSSGLLVMDFSYGNKRVAGIYPSDVGSYCNTWDLHSNPQCISTGGLEPSFPCSNRWCLVDPCTCGLVSHWDGNPIGATYHGMLLHFSYATCGDQEDQYDNIDDCIHHKTESGCSALSKCAWTGGICLDKDLAAAC